jgi:hypothetical protein
MTNRSKLNRWIELNNDNIYKSLLTSRSTWRHVVPEVLSAGIVPEVLLMCLEYVLDVCKI